LDAEIYTDAGCTLDLAILVSCSVKSYKYLPKTGVDNKVYPGVWY